MSVSSAWSAIEAEAKKFDSLSRSAASRFMRASANPIPRFLYKFMPIDGRGLEPALVKSTLWFSNPLTFNDPFDLRADVSLTHRSRAEQLDHIKRQLLLAGVPKSLRAVQANLVLDSGTLGPGLQRAYDDEVGAMGVCCFGSGTVRDTLMWSHYAKHHQGVCLVFATAGCPSVFARAQKVEYKPALVQIDWLDISARQQQLVQAVYTKALHWQYENEYRIIGAQRASTDLPFEPRALIGVILGLKSSPMEVRTVLELCKARSEQGLPPVRLFRAATRWTSNELQIQGFHSQ